MNINAMRMISVGVITGFIVMCKDSHFLNACTLIILSLAATHYRSSDIEVIE